MGLHGNTYYLFLYESAHRIRRLQPIHADLDANILATARASSEGVDFVSRFFAPAIGLPEDPVTGSAHTTLAPFWSERLAPRQKGQRQLHAKQLSARGGELYVELQGARVLISGRATFYMEGTILLPT